MDVAAGACLAAGGFDLADNLGLRPALSDPTRVVPWPNMPAFGILADPPPEQHGIALSGRVDLPIELRSEIVDPTVGQPFARIGIELGILVETFDLRRISRTPYAERTYAEFYPRLGRFHLFMQAFDEAVYVVPPPVVTR